MKKQIFEMPSVEVISILATGSDPIVLSREPLGAIDDDESDV